MSFSSLSLFSPLQSSIPSIFVLFQLSYCMLLEPRSQGEPTLLLLKNCRIGLCNRNLSVFNGTCPRYGFLPYLAWLDHSYTYWCIFCTIISLLFSMVYCKFLCFIFLLFFSYTPAILATHAKKWTKIIAGLMWLRGHFAANIFKIKLFNIKKRVILSAFKTWSYLICVSHESRVFSQC